MPDLLKGSPAETEKKLRALEQFKPQAFKGILVPTITQSTADAKLRWPSLQAWGYFGLGWGGKV